MNSSTPDPAANVENERKPLTANGCVSAASSIKVTPSPVTMDSKDDSKNRSKDGSNSSRPRKKPRLSHEQRVARIAGAVSTILECIDEDPEREGLRKTPQRYAKALLSLTEGNSKSAKDVIGSAKFTEPGSEVVLVRDISLYSLCEHHILPFHGICHISYIPNGTVMGLSKLARIVNLYARRLQVQERLTMQIADAVAEATSAKGVMVYVSATHMCMSMRGVHKTGAKTVTTATRGSYCSDAALRQEFLTSLSL